MFKYRSNWNSQNMFKYCSTYRNESRQDPRAKTCPTPIKATNRVKDPRAKTCPTPIKVSSHIFLQSIILDNFFPLLKHDFNDYLCHSDRK
ncbi:unnamed protein product [Rhizophagus irregularis]|nr:unnamed protein product [Rhizophagus irregularis]